MHGIIYIQVVGLAICGFEPKPMDLNACEASIPITKGDPSINQNHRCFPYFNGLKALGATHLSTQWIRSKYHASQSPVPDFSMRFTQAS